MNGRDRFRSREASRTNPHEFAEDLARQLSTLREILRAVSEEARLMDASLDDTHEIASRIGELVQHRVFGSDGACARSDYMDIYGQFEQTRDDESDVYEVYADDLERHQKRRRRDLAIADSDADKFAVVKRRRTYIAILFDLYSKISKIIDLLADQQVSSRRL